MNRKGKINIEITKNNSKLTYGTSVFFEFDNEEYSPFRMQKIYTSNLDWDFFFITSTLKFWRKQKRINGEIMKNMRMLFFSKKIGDDEIESTIIQFIKNQILLDKDSLINYAEFLQKLGVFFNPLDKEDWLPLHEKGNLISYKHSFLYACLGTSENYDESKKYLTTIDFQGCKEHFSLCFFYKFHFEDKNLSDEIVRITVCSSTYRKQMIEELLANNDFVCLLPQFVMTNLNFDIVHRKVKAMLASDIYLFNKCRSKNEFMLMLAKFMEVDNLEYWLSTNIDDLKESSKIKILGETSNGYEAEFCQ